MLLHQITKQINDFAHNLINDEVFKRSSESNVEDPIDDRQFAVELQLWFPALNIEDLQFANFPLGHASRGHEPQVQILNQSAGIHGVGEEAELQGSMHADAELLGTDTASRTHSAVRMGEMEVASPADRVQAAEEQLRQLQAAQVGVWERPVAFFAKESQKRIIHCFIENIVAAFVVNI